MVHPVLERFGANEHMGSEGSHAENYGIQEGPFFARCRVRSISNLRQNTLGLRQDFAKPSRNGDV